MKTFSRAFVFVVFSLSVLPCFSYAGQARHIGLFNDYIPEPRLIYPYTETADLRGKDFLEFKWYSVVLADSFDFRIYKGYSETASKLIFKQRVPYGSYTFKIKSDLFENNQIYTWTLKTIITGVGKSDESHVSFRIIKK